MKAGRFYRILTCAAALAALIAYPACEATTSPDSTQTSPSDQATSSAPKVSGTVLVKIGDSEVITWEEFNETYHLDRMGRNLNAAQMERLLENLVNQHLVYLEGLEKGYENNPEVVEQLERTKRQLISRYVIRDLSTKTPQVSEEDMLKYYDENPDKFKATYINYMFFNNRKFDNDPAKARAEAKKALTALKKGDDIAKITEEMLGRKSPMVMTARKNQRSFFGPEFDKAVWNTPIGGLSDIVETSQGYILVKVLKREVQTFEQAKAFIRQDLTSGAGQNRVENFYQELRKKYPVEIQRDVLEAKLPKTPTPPAPPIPPAPPRKPSPRTTP